MVKSHLEKKTSVFLPWNDWAF